MSTDDDAQELAELIEIQNTTTYLKDYPYDLFSNKYTRHNIIYLKENTPDKFGIFIMALKNLEESDDWYRICGIHGNTFKPNDPAVLCPTDPSSVTIIAKTGEPFYCAHSVEPFIAWHVPYIYQFELLLNKYNTSVYKEYITLPYFDITQQHYDYSFMNEPTITISFDGETITVDNPLAGAFYYKDNVKTRTTRCGFLNASTIKQYKQINTIRRQLNNTLRSRTYEEFSSNIVSYFKTFTPFNYIPLETPHNSIHDIIGGDGGNMSDISISAFDPIFWLHHCNMDRFFYNWLYVLTYEFTIPLDDSHITSTSLNSTLAPYFRTNLYSTDFLNYNYGWQNNTSDFLLLKDMLNVQKFPYAYRKIIRNIIIDTRMASVDLIDIPIPAETMTIDCYLYPNDVLLTDENKKTYYAGSASWFGINRTTMFCERCQVTRTNMKIDILDYILKHNIDNDSINNYTYFIEGNGKIIQTNNLFSNYSMEQIVSDGSVKIILLLV